MMQRKTAPVMKALRLVLVVLMLLWTLFPIYWMLATSLKPDMDVIRKPPDIWPQNATLEHYQQLINWAETSTTPVMQFFLNSAITSTATVLLALVLSVPASYVLSRFYFRLRRGILMGVLVTQMFPLVVLIIPLYILYRQVNLLNTYQGLIFAFVAFTLPFNIWMLKGYIDSVPREVDEAGVIDGCNRFQVMTKLILPVIKPGIVAVACFAFLDAWNNLLFPMSLVNKLSMKTLPAGMPILFAGDFKHDWGGMMATSVIVSVPVVIVFIALQRYLVEGLTSGSVKG